MAMAEHVAEVVTPQPKRQRQKLQQPELQQQQHEQQPEQQQLSAVKALKVLKNPRSSCYSSAYRKEETRARHDGCGKEEAKERGRAAGQAALTANGFA